MKFDVLNPLPGDDSGGGFAAQKAVEWAEEYLTLNAVEVA